MLDSFNSKPVRSTSLWVVDRHKLCAPWLLANNYCLSPLLPKWSWPPHELHNKVATAWPGAFHGRFSRIRVRAKYTIASGR